jgi:hypothetical protein
MIGGWKKKNPKGRVVGRAISSSLWKAPPSEHTVSHKNYGVLLTVHHGPCVPHAIQGPAGGLAGEGGGKHVVCSKSCRKKMVCWQLHSPIAEDTARKGLVITVFFFLVNSI